MIPATIINDLLAENDRLKDEAVFLIQSKADLDRKIRANKARQDEIKKNINQILYGKAKPS